MDKAKNTLIVIAGPTAVGKTETAIKLAKYFKTEIISFDSRQFYGALKIGTAVPSETELKQVKHHFIGQLQLADYYNVSKFENEALRLLTQLFKSKKTVVAVGGSGLYINALCHGIDDLPDASANLRDKINNDYNMFGLEWLQNQVKELDPDYFSIVDTKNPKRLLRALEVCLTTGKTFTEQRTAIKKERDFNIIKIALNLPRTELFDRINRRVDLMMKEGLLEEVRSVYPFKDLNSLKTVGYKELFDYLNGQVELEDAIEKIKTNTRRYAKRQIMWFKKDLDYKWFNPNDIEYIIEYINDFTK
ncbi:MAG: tRNA (adenosine(37)-N6)-dimethylallyltransferase MiaA [Bacteroidales bacterium]|nr:tRNA (adenosine(37)-N6)-dimethylallyltransferase MiaA [Bacteroidales bacterium]